MVKKKFIEKRSSVTYNLVFRNTDDVDELPQRLLVDAEKGVGVGRVDPAVAEATAAAIAASGRRYAPGHPLAWMEEEEATTGPMSDERRRELIELGFPDDGYDYLRHVRVLGRGTTSLEGATTVSSAAAAQAAAAAAAVAPNTAAPGPSVYMPAPVVLAPEEDRRLIDASRLTVMQAVQEDQAAAVMAGGVTAFSHERPRAHGVDKRELQELEAVMQEVEEDEEYGDADGAGDLLDDFVLAATEQGPEAEGMEDGGQGQESEGGSGADSEYESEASSLAGSGEPGAGESQAGSQGGRSGRAPARPGSIASTYWRDERSDRKNLLTVIDERFEHLALEYDEDEIGDLEEQGQQIKGFADVTEFENLLDEFLEVHGQSVAAAHEASGGEAAAAPRVSQVGREMEFFGFDDSDAAVAVQKAHEAVQRAEEEAAQEEAEQAAREARGEVKQEREPAFPEPRERERWDCESVLSLRSNLDNHPGSISEPRSYRPRRRGYGSEDGGAGGLIRLDARGMPVGFMPRRGMAGGPDAADGGHAGSDVQEEGAAATAVPERRKGETADEKRARKEAVKEAQRMARVQKKDMRSTFKRAEQVLQRMKATAQPQAAIKLPS
ncbi:hypothetical protein D9Q98_006647 [Chlorella vulgaris]|uniref:LTV1-like protein n=1 Tax=Chlorella vulgaris TaxID=3077 RepID=A0A9D4TKN7_CHLVU|nr:hypothetical protein D9Q98_006647 [Chlorella vulgaris]